MNWWLSDATDDKRCRYAPPCRSQPTKGAGTLRRAVRSQAFAKILGGRHMECAYYLVDGTWNVPTTLTFVGCAEMLTRAYRFWKRTCWFVQRDLHCSLTWMESRFRCVDDLVSDSRRPLL